MSEQPVFACNRRRAKESFTTDWVRFVSTEANRNRTLIRRLKRLYTFFICARNGSRTKDHWIYRRSGVRTPTNHGVNTTLWHFYPLARHFGLFCVCVFSPSCPPIYFYVPRPVFVGYALPVNEYDTCLRTHL